MTKSLPQRVVAIISCCHPASLLAALVLVTAPLQLAKAQEKFPANAPANAPLEEKRAANLPKDINDSFLDPNLNVDEFVKRFEVESREVFAGRKAILESLQLAPGIAVADVGAGTGLFVGPISKQVGSEGKVYAVDIAPGFVKHLRQRAKEEGLANVEVVLCSAQDPNLKPNSVDRILICDVYHHFEFPQSTMKALHAALRTNGKLIVIDFNRIEGKSREWTLNHVRAGKEVFQQEIIDAGFKLECEIPVEAFEENYLLRFTK
jgi:ubiquinone/menaquinone biosynthesis C-methylase UbiE